MLIESSGLLLTVRALKKAYPKPSERRSPFKGSSVALYALSEGPRMARTCGFSILRMEDGRGYMIQRDELGSPNKHVSWRRVMAGKEHAISLSFDVPAEVEENFALDIWRVFARSVYIIRRKLAP